MVKVAAVTSHFVTPAYAGVQLFFFSINSLVVSWIPLNGPPRPPDAAMTVRGTAIPVNFAGMTVEEYKRKCDG